jgi:uncharacterized small protein (DUF1192 family)
MYYDKESGARLFVPTEEEKKQQEMSTDIEALKAQVEKLTAQLAKTTKSKSGE